MRHPRDVGDTIAVEMAMIRDRLILIDEPETHLHPSVIKGWSKNLVTLGKHNYVFIATHSPFMINTECVERHIMVTKNDQSITEIQPLKKGDDMRGDEVLETAFGINVYKDLMSAHQLLLEGESDKKILNKAFAICGLSISITNGYGSNIMAVASRYNKDNIGIMVLLDGDKDGKNYKDKILKIGGVYGKDNVFTIHDLLEGQSLPSEATIEDLLGTDFVTEAVSEFIDNKDELFGIDENTQKGLMKRIRDCLHKNSNDKAKKNIDDDMKNIKTQIVENFVKNDFKSRKHFENDFPLLDKLVKNIAEKLPDNKKK